MSRKGGSYLMSTNFTDPNGATWTSAVSGMFRNMKLQLSIVLRRRHVRLRMAAGVWFVTYAGPTRR